MDDVMHYYKTLVPFLGTALGEHCEVALLDCRLQKIVAITNGHISGRSIGAPMTDLAERMIKNEEWKSRDFIANYSGYTADQKLLKSSTYFIKSENTLFGMLCINMDTSCFQLISDTALLLGGLVRSSARLEGNGNTNSETFQDNVTKTINQVLHSLYQERIPEHFTRDDRILILSLLQEKKLFLVKGAVHRIADVLSCSVPTIYRELALLKEK